MCVDRVDPLFVPGSGCPSLSVGMLLNMRFAEQYEAAESSKDYDVFAGLVKTNSMAWPVRRPIVYRDSMIELRYVFRLDGVYLVFRVGGFSKEWFARQWLDEEVGLFGRPDLAYQAVECVPGPFVVDIFDHDIQFYPSSDSYTSTSVK
ncbi:hypothetical protein KXX35_009626, partial [Aspergillus fumigatus]